MKKLCNPILFINDFIGLLHIGQRGRMNLMDKIIAGIKPLDEASMELARERVDFLAKPVGSLGKLEDIAIQLAGINKKVQNYINKKCTIVMAADNGIYEENVASTPQNVTAIQTINMVKGRSGISVLSKQADADLKVIDIGIKVDIECEGLVVRKIRNSTDNMAKGPAMSREDAIHAIETGMKIVEELVEEGYNLLGTGEMGIANTSTSSAILMSFTGCDGDIAVGKGSGLTDEGLQHKKNVIIKAININNPDKNDPLDVLSKVGGLDIAGLTGCFLAAAYYRIPIVIDGVISSAAALTAYRFNKMVAQYMIPSHCSLEPAYDLIMKEMNMNPMLMMNMRLGEGTGCPLAFHIVESSCAMMNHMATFEELDIETDYMIDIRE